MIPLDKESRAGTVLTVIDRAIEQGFLPASPLKDACASCDYRIVCGLQEGVCVSRKRGECTADLLAVRGLP